MLVVGAGLSRTGTLSTKAALEVLVGPCYHGSTPLVDRQDHIQLWAQALEEGRLDQARTREELGGYVCGLDLPLAAWYKELMLMYPEAKVILTVREPRAWYASISLIMRNMVTLTYDWPYSWATCLSSSRELLAYYQRTCLARVSCPLVFMAGSTLLSGMERSSSRATQQRWWLIFLLRGCLCSM